MITLAIPFSFREMEQNWTKIIILEANLFFTYMENSNLDILQEDFTSFMLPNLIISIFSTKPGFDLLSTTQLFSKTRYERKILSEISLIL